MKRVSRLVLAAAAAGLSVVGFSSRALAVYPVYVDNPYLNVKVLNTQALQTLVVQALRELSSQNTTNITNLGKLETNLADVQNKSQVKYGIDTARLAAINAATNGTNDCNFLMASSSFSGYAAQVSQWREQLVQQNLDWVGNAPKINGQPNPSAVSSTAAFARLDAAACAAGVSSPATIEAGGCGSNTTPGTNAGLDTNANQLFKPTAMSPKESVAAQLFLNRAVSPEPLPALKPVDVSSGQAGAIIASRDALVSRLSAADWVLGGVIARRQPWAQGPANLAKWANGTAAQLNGHIPQTNGSYFPNGVSEMDWMHLQADNPMFNQKFIAATAVAGESSNIKTLVRLISFGNWERWKLYQLQEQELVVNSLRLAQSQEPTARVGNR